MNSAFDNAMRRQIFSIPPLLQDEFETIKNRASSVLSPSELSSIQTIILTGCGDSYCACLCVKQAFEALTQLPVEVVPALNLARYYPMATISKSTLVVGVSNSGRVPRVAEALTLLGQHGALTLAITSNAQSPLALAARHTFVSTVPKFEQSPGVCSYAVAMLSMFLFAIYIAGSGTLSQQKQAQQCEQELFALVSRLTEHLHNIDSGALAFAQKYAEANSCEFIGAGQAAGCAMFAQQKMYEAVGLPSVVCEPEEWFHSNKFIRDFAHTLTIIFTDKQDPANSRTTELIQRMHFMNRDFALVTNDNALSADAIYFLPESKYSYFLPMAEFFAPSLVSAYLSVLKNETYSRGFTGNWREEEGIPSTVCSKIVLLD